MVKKYLWFTILFVCIGITYFFAELQQHNTLKLITKPLILLSLLVMFYICTSLNGRFHKRLFAGLLFAFAGDVLLLFNTQDTILFIYGLLSLICHICFVSAFYLDFRSAPQLDKRGARIAIITCGIFSIVFYLYIRPYLGMMKLPVLAYTFSISMMLMMAAFRNLRVNKLSFNLVLIGAIFFLVSDALLAYNKFVMSFNLAPVFIMFTYILAQYLIVIGGIERKLLHKNQ